MNVSLRFQSYYMWGDANESHFERIHGTNLQSKCMDLFGKLLHSILKSNMILGVQELIIGTRTVIKK